MFVKVLISVLVLICENMSLMSAWNRLAVFWAIAELHIPHVGSSLYQIWCCWPENPPFSIYKNGSSCLKILIPLCALGRNFMVFLTILLIKRGPTAPNVIQTWRSRRYVAYIVLNNVTRRQVNLKPWQGHQDLESVPKCCDYGPLYLFKLWVVG